MTVAASSLSSPTPPLGGGRVGELTDGDTLDGEAVLSGFTVPVADLLPGPAAG